MAAPTAASQGLVGYARRLGDGAGPHAARSTERAGSLPAVTCPSCPLANSRRSLGTVIADLRNPPNPRELTLGNTTTSAPMTRLPPDPHAGAAVARPVTARRQRELAPTDPGHGRGPGSPGRDLLQWPGSRVLRLKSHRPAHAIAQRVSAGAWWTVIMLIFDSGTTSRSTPG